MEGDVEIHKPGEYGFGLGVVYTDAYFQHVTDPSYSDITFNQDIYEIITNKDISLNATELPKKVWGNDFPLPTKRLVEDLDLKEAICLNTTDWSIGGSYFTYEYRVLRIKFKKCTGAGCQSDTDIATKLYAGRLNLSIVNKYFDLDDYDEPIKNYLDDRFSYRLTQGFTKVVNVYLKKNVVTMQDNLFQYQNAVTKEFYKIDRTQTDLSDAYPDGTLIEVNLLIDGETEYHERKVYSFLDMTGQIGGIFEIVKLILGGIVGFFANRLFTFSVLKKLYQVDSNLDNSSNCDASVSKVHPICTDVSNNEMIEEGKSSHIPAHTYNFYSKKTTKPYRSESVRLSMISNADTIREAHNIDSIAQAIKSRKIFKYGVKSYIMSYLSCLKWKSIKVANKYLDWGNEMFK